MAFQGFDLSSFWEISEFADREYVDEPLTDDLLARVEVALNYKLPIAYVALCRTQNGGLPARTCYRTSTRTSWAADHVAISGIKAIAFEKRWSLCGSLGHQPLIDEWGYPPIGVYFGDCPSAGHDMICLDYRQLNSDGEPRVAHVDQEVDYVITPLADSFELFIRGLQAEDAFPLN